MKILAVDDERAALNILTRAIQEAVPNAEFHSFQRVDEAIVDVQENGFSPEVAFLDIEMPDTTGLELAAKLKIIHPDVNIVFVTSYSNYAIEALALRPSGYVMKPATKEKILAELENLRNPPARTDKRNAIQIQCFGSFEVFFNGQPVQFSRAKSKEVLAYLVDRRGSACSSSDIADALWDDGVYDRSRQKQLSVIKLELFRSLKQIGSEDIVTKNHDALAIDPQKVDCDYYMALNGDVTMMNTFIGEYMMPYAWAETTTATLVNKFA